MISLSKKKDGVKFNKAEKPDISVALKSYGKVGLEIRKT
jgi:hypothetical protein